MKKLLAFVVSVILLSSIIVPTICVAEEPFVITMLTNYVSFEAPPADHEIFKIIEEETGAKFDVTWIPDSGYNEKVLLTLASGDMPMVFNACNQTRKPAMLEAQRAGIFWELTPELLSEFPTLSNLNPAINKNLMVDGKLYCLYRERPVGRSNIVFRKDWIEKMNLPVPQDIESLDKVLRAFTTQDPDGNGKDDTCGIYIHESGFVEFLVNFMSLAFGGSNKWEEKDGKFTPAFATDEFIKGLDQLKAWYADGVLNSNFVATTAVQDVYDQFCSQKIGILMPFALDDALKQGDLYTVAPDAVIDILPTFFDVNGGEYVLGQNGNSGGYFFPKSAIKTEEELKKVLRAMDIINDKNGRVFEAMVWGLEGRHYTRNEKGQIVQTKEQKELRNREVNNFIQMRVNYDHWGYTGDNAMVSDLQAAIFKGWQYNQNFAKYNPAEALLSDTYMEIGSDLDRIRNDAMEKYVMGEITLDEYMGEVQKWYDFGGSKVVAEYEAAFAASK